MGDGEEMIQINIQNSPAMRAREARLGKSDTGARKVSRDSSQDSELTEEDSRKSPAKKIASRKERLASRTSQDSTTVAESSTVESSVDDLEEGEYRSDED